MMWVLQCVRSTTMRLLGVVLLSLVFALTLSLTTDSLSLQSRVSLRVSPMISYELGYLRLTAIVQKNPLNRDLQIELEGSSGYFSSSTKYHGPDGPLQTIVDRKDLPAGTYTAIAAVTQADGKLIVSKVENIQVIDREVF